MPTLDCVIFPQRVPVAGFILCGIPPQLPCPEFIGIVPTVFKDGVGILKIGAPGTPHRKSAGIGARQGGIQRQLDQLTAGTGNGRFHHIPLGKSGPRQCVCRPFFLQHIGMHSPGTGGNRSQRKHPVAVIDMQQLGNRPKLMGRVVFRIAVQIIAQTVVPVFGAVGDLLPQIMVIAALTERNFAKKAFPRHAQRHQLTLAVAAVFQQHAGHTGALRRIHQPPAIRHGIGPANLHGHSLAGLHCRHRNSHVGFPCGHHHHSIHIHGNQLMVVRCTERPCTAIGLNSLRGGLHTVGIGITYAAEHHIHPAHRQQDIP